MKPFDICNQEHDHPHYKEIKPHYFKRILWTVINYTIFRVLVGYSMRYVRNIILRMFGAKIPLFSLVYPSATIFAPWNLEVGRHSCIGPRTKIYNKDIITIGDYCVISQGAYLCTASHDISKKSHDLITKPIIIKNRAWVAAEAFVGMGVTIGEGAVVGARAAVFKDVEPWTVLGGNPAKMIKKSVIN